VQEAVMATNLGQELVLLCLRAVVLNVRHHNVRVQRKARARAEAVTEPCIALH
jgi:hypothetical protein